MTATDVPAAGQRLHDILPGSNSAKMPAVCTENPIRVDGMTESRKLAE